MVVRPAGGAVDEPEDRGERLTRELGGGPAKEAGGGRVGEEDAAAGIGDQHAFAEGGKGRGGERFVEAGGGRGDGRHRSARLGGGLGRGQGADEADDADEIALAVESAVRAEQKRAGFAVGGEERDRLDERRAAGRAAEEPDFQPGNRFGGGQATAEGGEGVGFLVVAEQPSPGGGHPVELLGEIEFEGAERTGGAAEVLEPGIVGEAGLFEFAAFGDVEAETGDAFEFPGGADLLESGALEPDVVAAAMAHAELDEDAPRAGGVLAAEEIGRGGGVVGVDVLQPGVVGVGQLGVDVAEEFFPDRGVADAVGREMQVEVADDVLLDEQRETVLERGRDRDGGRRLDDGDVAGGAAEGGFEADELFARGALARLDGEGRGALEGGAEDDFPLGFAPVGIVGNDFEEEQGGERFADELRLGNLPEGAGGGVGGGDAAGGVDEHDRGGRGGAGGLDGGFDGGGGAHGLRPTKPTLDALGEEIDVGRLVVETRNLPERLAAGLQKCVAAFDGDFLDRLQAVGDEGGTDDQEALFSLPGQAREFVVGEGREPRFAGEAGLERDGVFIRSDAGAGDEGARGGEDLGLVAGGVGGRAGRATVGDERAVGLGRIALAQVALGDAVVTEEQVVVRLREVGRRDGVQCLDVVGVLEKRLHGGDLECGGEPGADREDLGDDRFP